MTFSGGHNRTVAYLPSTFLFNESSNSWTAGPDLPSARSHHCVANINSLYSFLAGGNSGKSDAWIYSWLEDEWIQVPDMPAAKAEMACTLYTNEMGQRHIIMAGADMVRGVSTLSNAEKAYRGYVSPQLLGPQTIY